MRERFLSRFMAGTVLLFLPCLLTMMINGTDTVLSNRKISIEDILPVMLSQQIPNDYEEEALKSQAVIARTNLYRKMGDNETADLIWKDLIEIGSEILFKKISWKTYEKAVKETERIVLTYKGEFKQIPYHTLSNGQTRSGEEVFYNKEYAYLKAVDSSMDKTAKEYLHSTYILRQFMPEHLEIRERDSSGYVLSLSADGHILEGEAFRQGMGFPSPDFTLQEIDGTVRILCKGKGHGLGFSQNGGNEMAKEGSSYQDILETYFPELDVGEISFSL